MALRVGGANFSKGEIAEDLIGRVDVAAYQTGARRLRNVVGLKYGGVTKRSGTRLVAEAYDGTKPVRLMPFQFSLTQTYALEMGQGYMRPAANGGLVLEGSLTITAITLGVTTTIAAAFHAYEVGDQVYLSGISGTTQLNGRVARVVAVLDDGHFTIDVNSTGFGTFTADSGGIVRVEEPDPLPEPPPVSTPVPPPPPPPVGGGGYGGGFCVTADTLILLADGSEIAAGDLTVDTLLRTRHEATFSWGHFPVTHCETVWSDDIWDVEGLKATGGHRTRRNGCWVRHEDIGTPIKGGAMVVKVTVADAHTYISAGVLSHNIKMQHEVQP